MSANTAAEVTDWYERYAATFVEQAASAQPQPARLLEFYAVPATMTTPAGHLGITSPEALRVLLDQGLCALGTAGYARSAESDRSVRVLHDRAALIEATWTRYHQDGTELDRAAVVYLAARTDQDGWRFTAISTNPA